MDNCWGKAILIILAIAFFPITITIFIFKSNMEIKGKLVATAILWVGLFIGSMFLPDDVKDKVNEKPSIVSESLKKDKDDSSDSNNEPSSDYDTERIIREGHPVLLDKINIAEEFWADDMNANAVVIRNKDEQEYPYAYLIIESGAFNEDSDDKLIQSVQAWFYNCGDAQMFRLEKGIEIIRSYLPLDVLNKWYTLQETNYQNIWIDNWESDGTKKPNFQYDYYTNYKLSDENNKLPPWISVHVYLDGWGLVQGAAVYTTQYQHDSANTYEWNYDFLDNNSDYNTGSAQWDFELLIQYPRPSGYPALKKGDKGDEVGWIQTALNKAMDARIDVDCSFGGGTDSAIREFQSRCGLGTDGSAGSQTIAMLIDIISGNKRMPEKNVETEAPKNEQMPTIQKSISSPSVKQEVAQSFVLNVDTKVFHYEGCHYERIMKEENKEWIYGTVSELRAMGYNPCGKCHPN